MTAASAVLRVCRLRPQLDGDVPLPRAMSAEAAGLDVCAAVPVPLVLGPGERVAVPTGFALAVPPGWEVQVRPRSGLAIRYGVTLINSPGTIDSDYRGEVKVLLVNHGREPFTIERGMRIAQLVVARLAPISVEEVDSLDPTARGSGGFGSTGTAPPDPHRTTNEA
jgi:dUTP pyrophosphatase